MPFIGTLEPSQIAVDWISATATEFYARRDLQRAAAEAIDQEVHEGNERRVWRWREYEGFQAGQVRWGERRDSLYCQLSGHASSVSWLTLLNGPCNVTRLDVQVTCPGVPLWCDLAEQQWEEIESDRQRQREAGTYSWYVTRPHGSTLYIGAPASDVRLRLYDKGSESPQSYPPGTWRYEVQARNGVAGALASHLAYNGDAGVAGGREVYHRFRTRGVQPAFAPSGVRVLGPVPRPPADDDRTLKWLDTQVRPAIGRLAHHGRGDDARRALDIDADG